MTTVVAGLTDVGRRRSNNQDRFLVDESMQLYAVADGMGGHAAGEVASGLAIEALTESLRQSEPNDDHWTPAKAAASLRLAMNEGNRRIGESMVAHEEWRGMGTTVVAMLVVGERAVIGHVGDSRAYLLRDNRLSRLTSDHSWVNEQVKRGLLSEEEAHRHPMRNIVTRALGSQPHVEVDVAEEPVRPGDLFVLCSDGLNTMLGDDEIRRTLEQHRDDPGAACRALVREANARGGDDNVTVIVVKRSD